MMLSPFAFSQYESSLQSYWKLDDMSWDDNFMGTSVNTEKWQVSTTSGCTATQNNGAVTLTTVGNGTDKGNILNSKLDISGDFDINVTWNVSSLPNPSSSWNEIMLYVNGDNTSGGSNYFLVREMKTATASKYEAAYRNDGPWGSAGSIDKTGTSGKFRIKRTNANFTGYYWENNAWQSLGTLSSGWTGDVKNIQMNLRSYLTQNTLAASFSNFTVDIGETVSDSQGISDGKIYYATQSTGKFGKALNFDGLDDYVQINNGVTLTSSNDWSLSTWVKTTNQGTTTDATTIKNVIFGNNPGASNINFGIDNGKITTHIYDGSWQKTRGSVNVADGEWHLLTWAKDASGIKMYVDNVMDGVDTHSLYGSSTISRLGNYNSGYFTGLLDDVGIWNKSLTQNEIASLLSIGTEKFEWITAGINGTGARQLNLNYSDEQRLLLANTYGSLNTTYIDGVSWKYLSGNLPGDIGGTTYNYGDAWIYDGKYYIKLGSGLEGTIIPEASTLLSVLLSIFFLIFSFFKPKNLS